MDNSKKVLEGLEKAYWKLVEFKKYKKTPLVVFQDGKIVELNPEEIGVKRNVYR